MIAFFALFLVCVVFTFALIGGVALCFRAFNHLGWSGWASVSVIYWSALVAVILQAAMCAKGVIVHVG